jgi:2-polyprenyl-3-methyl-5-hydroxy-6-metoxy-1,4-benzoquinol methylase
MPALILHTQHPIAVDSLDHKYPTGTRKDNSTNPRFNARLYKLFPGQTISVLDIGCAGGGFVESVINDGHFAVGLEGSDFSRNTGRAAWPALDGKNLFCCDVTHPFTLDAGDGEPYQFDVVTAWVMVEHIEQPDLPAMWENIYRHLSQDGMFFVTTASTPSVPKPGIDLHRTRKSGVWWQAEIEAHGFKHDRKTLDYFGRDLVRYHDINFVFRKA